MELTFTAKMALNGEIAAQYSWPYSSQQYALTD